MVLGIRMICDNYVNNGNGFKLIRRDTSLTSSSLIQSMLNSQEYYAQIGGITKNGYTLSRKFGKVVKSIEVISPDNRTKMVYTFDYSNAYNSNYERQASLGMVKC